MRLPPSGERFEIHSGGQRATIVEVGGGIREYSVAGRPVLDPYPLEAKCDGAHGAPLIPWPNRLADGRYSFEGKDHRVALTEPDKANAIHGLLRWRPWRTAIKEADRVVMETTLAPMTGYPFHLQVEIDYRLDETGLTVATTVTNVGPQKCPYGAGHHPYLSPGDGLIDHCSIKLDAQTRILTDPDRQLPIGRESVVGTRFDFRSARLLGDLEVDFAFDDLQRDESGRGWISMNCPDGRTVSLWVDEHYSLIQMYTGDTLSADRARRGLGAEPMTCPPNGLQTGEGIHSISPGESLTTIWGAQID